MAISTYSATLKWGDQSASIAKVVDIKDFPDLIGDPNMLETTTLSDAQQTYIPGIKSADMLTFTVNYTSEVFELCTTTEGDALFFALEFSDGSQFTWQGSYSLGLPGKGVDEVVEFTINIAPSSAVAFTAAP